MYNFWDCYIGLDIRYIIAIALINGKERMMEIETIAKIMAFIGSSFIIIALLLIVIFMER